MQVLDYLDNIVANDLLVKQIADKKTRPQTDKLSGSLLGQPLQEQVLKIIGVPPKDFDPFVLRKFERGHQVESWVTSVMPGLLTNEQVIAFAKERGAPIEISHDQPSVLYRGATGHVDAICDMKEWGKPELGIIPHEIKSITNLDYNKNFGPRAYHRPEAKWHHKLQIGLYALALKCDTFMIHYVASDDFRIKSFLIDTDEVAKQIDDIITEVHTQLKTGMVPAFEARETWQANPDYQNYPSWAELSSEEATERLQKEYPDQYTKLQILKGGE